MELGEQAGKGSQGKGDRGASKMERGQMWHEVAGPVRHTPVRV